MYHYLSYDEFHDAAPLKALTTGLSLRGGGGGGAGIFPGPFLRKIEEKIEEKEIPGCFIPRLLVEHIFTRQLKTLVTSLAYHIRKMQTICY